MPLDLAPPTGWQARLALRFERRGERTVLASREHEGPLVVQRALHPEGPSPCHAIVVHPPAGLVGGDGLVLDVVAGPGAQALLTTPGAGKWYRAPTQEASQRVTLDIAAGAAVEWLPQETILYDGAQARLAWHARLAGDARLIAWEVTCLGRVGSGEAFARGRCRLEMRVSRDGRLQWLERGRIAPGSNVATSPAALGGAPAFGTFLVAAPGIADAWLAGARECRPAEGQGAVTRLPGVLLARWRGHETEAARAYFAALWSRLREPVLGRPAVPPRIWRT